MTFNVGDIFKIEYPFYNHSNPLWAGAGFDFQPSIIPGCHKIMCEDDAGGWVDWVANGEGLICYEILAIAEMPSKYTDRVIVKFWYEYKDTTIRPRVKTLTVTKLAKQIENQTVFPFDYEIDEHYKGE